MRWRHLGPQPQTTTSDHNLGPRPEADAGPTAWKTQPMRTGVQPGSFDPPTLAHLVIAHTALRHHRLDQIVWSVSRRPLGKEEGRTTVDDRLAVLEAVTTDHRWLAIKATDARLVADITDGHDVVVMGADKWHQLRDPGFYGHLIDGDTDDAGNARAAMTVALGRLPTCAVAPRDGLAVPPEMALPVPRWVARQSSSSAVAGASWMALSVARLSGLWPEVG